LLLPIALVVIMASMLSAIVTCWHACPLILTQAGSLRIFAALAVCLGYCLANATAWVFVLRALGYRLDFCDGIGVWTGCEAFRWLPGSVWSLGARSVEAAKRGVPVLVTMATIAVELILAVLSRMVIIAVACLAYASTIRSLLLQIPWPSIAALAAALLAFALMTLFVVKGGIRARCRQRIRELYLAYCNARLRWTVLAGFLGYHVVIRVLHGLALSCVVAGIAPEASIPLGIIIAANAAAWLLGFCTVFAPGGLVVREAVLATVFAAWMSPAESLAIAITWRMLQVVSEAILFTSVWVRSQWCKQTEWITVP
jgi:hypothetical protein